ncbi:MAG TPA: hypothetical protein EYO61_04470 [Campylobacterales bacterium]|nr:hypothetical protein [Campylobacterales bacterium]HIO71382.1 hypothetical protein [Campylobacterales bacterium]
MGYQDIDYLRVKKNLDNGYIHLKRIDEAIEEIEEKYRFPIDRDKFEKILQNRIDLAFSDQIIYRFSKLQDLIGAKLFKSFLLYQGENVDKPFRDILNRFEKIKILDVEEWFELRQLRNEIAHNYESSQDIAIEILNGIFEKRNELRTILDRIDKLTK